MSGEKTEPSGGDHGICWKRNLAFTWVAQVLSLMGFSFAMNFAAYYIQDLGVTDMNKVKIWTGIYQAAGPLTFMIMGPVWGMVGDRFGRRMMLLRANLMAAIVLFLMGCVSSVEHLIILRLAQGLFTGTVPASMALVAATTPERRQGMALGSLQASIVVGWMAGSALGGYLADVIGYADTIKMAGGLLLLSFLVAAFGIREDFQPPVIDKQATNLSRARNLFRLEGALPILGLLAFVALARRFDTAVLPLFVQELNGNKLQGSATLMGQLTASGCVAVTIASLGAGWLTDRFRPATVTRVMALVGGAIALAQFYVDSFVALLLVRTLLALFMGGIDPAFNVWLAKTTRPEKRGAIMGFSTSAKSIGWAVAALTGGYLATYFPIRLIITSAGVLILLVVPLGYLLCPSVETVDETEAEVTTT